MRCVRLIETTPTGHVIRHSLDQVGNNLTAELAWCATHCEPVWIYGDGSFSCPHELVVGWSSDGEHRLTSPPWEVVGP